MSERLPRSRMGMDCSKLLYGSQTSAVPTKIPRIDSSSDKAIVNQPGMSSSLARNGALGAEKSSRTSEDSATSRSKPEKQVKGFGESSLSVSTVENVRYSLEGTHQPDHWNEDARLIINDQPRFKAMAVFDGHDGSNAVERVCSHFHTLFSRDFLHEVKVKRDVTKVLEKFFASAESDFFQHINMFVKEKRRLQSRIPEGLTSYEAYVQYPVEVARLQEIEPKIAGGTTAVVAVIYNEQLYIANTGDSRAYVIEELPNGTLGGRQLSTDHGLENEEEVIRLEVLGLDVKELKKSGRLGTQENTRSIGDYCIKGGYKDVDVLSNAAEPPGTAIPSINGPIDIKHSFRYLLLMSDGVYKSIEAVLEPQTNKNIESDKVLLVMLIKYLEDSHGSMRELASNILERIRRIHEDTYKNWTKEENPLAVQCRKRDDMTLVVYKFGGKFSMV